MTIISDIQHNCNVSDAKDHGIYSMCTMVLKLRNLYKWEHGLEPWQEAEPGDLLDWIDAKEEFWQTIAGNDFRDIVCNGVTFSPDSLVEINRQLRNKRLVYGAGYGRSMKAVFFVAEKLKSYTIEGMPVMILGRELAKEMASPFAMAQDGEIIIRRDSLRFFLWDQMQELSSTCRSSFHHALQQYGVVENTTLNNEKLKERLDLIVDRELNLFIYHEVGELLQGELDSSTLQNVVSAFPGSVIELVCRTTKDILADCHPKGLLAYCVREGKETSLSFYIGFLDGLRKKMFPEIFVAWQQFLLDKDWAIIEKARKECWLRNRELAAKLRKIADDIGIKSKEKLQEQFHFEVIKPLGLKLPD